MTYNELICSYRRLQQAILLSRFIFAVHFFLFITLFKNKFFQQYRNTGPVNSFTKCKSCIVYSSAGKHSSNGRPHLLKSEQTVVWFFAAVTYNIEASVWAKEVLTHFRNLAIVLPTRRKTCVACEGNLKNKPKFQYVVCNSMNCRARNMNWIWRECTGTHNHKVDLWRVILSDSLLSRSVSSYAKQMGRVRRCGFMLTGKESRTWWKTNLLRMWYVRPVMCPRLEIFLFVQEVYKFVLSRGLLCYIYIYIGW